MYQQNVLQDYLFMMLYGAAAMFAVVACLYLLLRRANFISPNTEPPIVLRRWTAGFLSAVVLSHVWWIVVGNVLLTSDRFVRNAINIMLDSVTLVPLMMVTLLRMLQDRHRPVWPIFAATLPVVGITIGVGIVGHNPAYEWMLRDYLLLFVAIFVVYMVFAVRRYGRWRHENHADLEHKEMWQSLVLLAIILLIFVSYKTNFGNDFTEYVVQVNTIVLTVFLLWRVETLQQLDAADEESASENEQEPDMQQTEGIPNVSTPPAHIAAANIPSNIGALLEKQCEATHLYLRHDLTLSQLSIALGTNRTYLSAYFANQGITYNTYINRLRIEHFMHLYHEATKASDPFTARQLAQQCGYRSYTTFIAAFKAQTGTTFSEWLKKE